MRFGTWKTAIGSSFLAALLLTVPLWVQPPMRTYCYARDS